MINWLTDKDKQARDKAKRQAIHAAMQKHEKAHQEYIHSPEHLKAVAAYRQEQAQEAHEAIYKLEEGKRIADALKAATMARIASGELIIPSYEYEAKPLSQMGFEWQMKKQLKNLLNGTSKAITLNADVSAVSWSWTSSNSSCVSLSGQTDTDTQSSITATANATGNATISCVMTDVDGTTYRGSLKVVVSAAPPVTELTVALNMNLPASMIEGASTMAILTGATATGGTAPYTYEYSVSGVNASGTFRNNVADGWTFLSDYTNTDNLYLWGCSAAPGTLTIKVVATDSKGNTGEDSVDIPVSAYSSQAGYLLTGPSLVFLGQPTGVYYDTVGALPVIGIGKALDATWFCACQNADNGTYTATTYKNAGSTGGITTTFDSTNMTCHITSSSVSGTTSQYYEPYADTIKDTHGNSRNPNKKWNYVSVSL